MGMIMINVRLEIMIFDVDRDYIHNHNHNNYKNHTLNILLKSPISLRNFLGFFAGKFQR